jgi:hypothetical protein
VALEKPVYSVIEKLARKRRISLSMVTRDLIREALEIHEDTVLVQVATRAALPGAFMRQTAVQSKAYFYEAMGASARGLTFWFRWKTLSGSQDALTLLKRS